MGDVYPKLGVGRRHPPDAPLAAVMAGRRRPAWARPAAVAALAATAGLTVAGCGTTSARRPLTAAERAGATALQRAESALDARRSVRITTTLITSAGARTRSVAAVTVRRRVDVWLTRGAQRSQLSLRGGGTGYLHGNAAYWRYAGARGEAAQVLAAHWFSITVDDLSGAGSLQVLASPRTLGRCTLGLPSATATVAASSGGTHIITERVPGAPPTVDRITVAADGLPRSVVRTGPNIDYAACGIDGTGVQIRSGTITLDRFDARLPELAPTHVESDDAMQDLLAALGSRTSTTGSG